MDLQELAEWLNPIVRGWMNYYGEFNRFEMYSLLERINTYLMRWARKKYKRLRTWKRFKTWWRGADRERARTVRPLGMDARVPLDRVRRAE